ncbi:MAG: HflK protein, partial [Rhodobacterales bacterium]|nr:HflK protein [Rhodobacterales bacterium]
MAGNSGGPWGGGGNRGGGGGDDDRRNNGGGRRPGEENGPQIPEIDELMRKGQEQRRVLMGGRGGRGGTGGGGEGGPRGPIFTRSTVGLGILAAVGLW